MLAAPAVNRARARSGVPSRTIFARPNLHSYVARQTQTLRKRRGPTCARGGSGAPTGAPQPSFYNRLSEQRAFKAMFDDVPGVITVLVGPPNCGKTRFMQQFRDQYKADPNAPPFIYINSRQRAVDGPVEISKALCDAVTSKNVLSKLQKFPDLVQSILKNVSETTGVPTPVGDFSVKLVEFIRKDEGDLIQTIKKLGDLFGALAPLDRMPVIVIDGANELMNWREMDSGPSERQLGLLLNFLISISKEANLVHVVLATSDYFLASWLTDKGMTTDKFQVRVIGDLPEEEARAFVFGDSGIGTWLGIINSPSSPNKVPSGAEEQW